MSGSGYMGYGSAASSASDGAGSMYQESRVGFSVDLDGLAQAQRQTPPEPFEFKFEVTVYPDREPRWLTPLNSEVHAVAHSLGSTLDDMSGEFDRFYGRVVMRWNAEIVPGFHMPLTTKTTQADVDALMREHKCDQTRALQKLGEMAWAQHYAAKAREAAILHVVRAELPHIEGKRRA